MKPALQPPATLAIPYCLIELGSLRPDPAQPRTRFHRIAELADSIRTYGLLKPILVAPHGSEYLVIAGERRYRALVQLHASGQLVSTAIPCCVADSTKCELLKLALIENLQREELTMWDAGRVFELMSENGATQREISGWIGKSLGYVANCLLCWRGLAPSVRDKLAASQGALTVRDVLKLASLTDEFGEPDCVAQEKALLLRMNYSPERTPRQRVHQERESKRTEASTVWDRYSRLRDGKISLSHLTGAEREFLGSVLAFLAGYRRSLTDRSYTP
jgi:ParB/RepB/Spo0J family partition protein